MPEQRDRVIGGSRRIHSRLFECFSLVAPSSFDRLVSGYRLTQSALLGDPYCTWYIPAADISRTPVPYVLVFLHGN